MPFYVLLVWRCVLIALSIIWKINGALIKVKSTSEKSSLVSSVLLLQFQQSCVSITWQNSYSLSPGWFQVAFLLLLLEGIIWICPLELHGCTCRAAQRNGIHVSSVPSIPGKSQPLPHPLGTQTLTLCQLLQFCFPSTTLPGVHCLHLSFHEHTNSPWPYLLLSSAGLSSLAWNSGINLTIFPLQGLTLPISWRWFSCWYLKMNCRIIPIWNVSGQQHQIKRAVRREWKENDDRALFVKCWSSEEGLSLVNAI